MPKMKKGSKFFGHRLAQIFTDLVKIGFKFFFIKLKLSV